MKSNIYLKDLESDFKIILILFLSVLSIGIFTGLAYVYLTTTMTPSGTIEQFNGPDNTYEYDYLDNAPLETTKYANDLLLTTHNHLITFSMISLFICIVFYFNSIITGKFKLFLIFEPFISTILTFASLWLMRYLNDSFVYIMIFSAILMYICWYLMIFISIYELAKKNN